MRVLGFVRQVYLNKIINLVFCPLSSPHIGRNNFFDWFVVGVKGFGVGSSIYKAGDKAKQVSEKSKKLVRAFDEANARSMEYLS